MRVSSFLFVCVSILAPSAHADVTVSIESSIAAAHARDATPFDAVRNIVAQADALDHRKRGRFYPMTPLLRGVTRGHAGSAMALLEPIVSPNKFTMPHSDTARIALRAGLLEAAGDQKDPLAAPVYRSVIATATEFFEVRAATEALGKLALDADIAMLSRLVIAPSSKRDAVLAGLGECRRSSSARALASVAAQNPTGMTAKYLLRSLSSMGSAWALATPNASPASETTAIRDTTARAAFAMFTTTQDAETRTDASNALMVIDAPDTPRWIAEAKSSASADLASALDALATRFAHNPTRRTR